MEENLESRIALYCRLEQPINAYELWCEFYVKENLSEKSEQLLFSILNLVYNFDEIKEIVIRLKNNKLSLNQLYKTMERTIASRELDFFKS